MGGGNHFLDALAPYEDEPLHFLIHTGSRNESGLVDELVDQPESFDREFARVVNWAFDNRSAIQEAIQSVYGPLDLVLDLPHNTFEKFADDSVIIRKGAVKLLPGQYSVIPSNMSGDVVVVRATERIKNVLCSMSHGTGRIMSRGECKPLADAFDFNKLRQSILIPAGIEDASLRTEGPYAYRNLDDCLALVNEFVEETARFGVVGYMGHL